MAPEKEDDKNCLFNVKRNIASGDTKVGFSQPVKPGITETCIACKDFCRDSYKLLNGINVGKICKRCLP
ncbi:MAG: hypothetical protein KGS72_24180 [Cyanobacteria bacterium REEB67]|nr:hypothetical protein [Cyanobacteria bacterium REEB67]